MRLAPALLLLASLAACGDGDSVGEFSNDWTGNDIMIEAIADSKVQGVTCHFSYFDRSVIDRLSKGNWFENPSNNSIACRQTGPIVIGDIDADRAGEEVFSQRHSLLFKRVGVRRIFDRANNTLVYVAYSREIVEGSAKMSLSTISLYGQNIAWAGRPDPAQ